MSAYPDPDAEDQFAHAPHLANGGNGTIYILVHILVHTTRASGLQNE